MALKDNLVSYYTLDESANTTRVDSHGSVDLSSDANDSSISGKISNCISFAGNGYSRTLDGTTFNPGDANFAFGMWVRLDATSATDAAFISKFSHTTSDRQYYMKWDAGDDRFQFTVYADGDGTGQTSINADTFGAPTKETFYYVFCYHDADNDVIGISVNDGARDTAAFSAGVFDDTDARFYIGRTESALWGLTGEVDELAYWQGGIPSLSDVATIYNSDNGLAYSLWDVATGINPIWTARRRPKMFLLAR
jgi:hypothetical protein